MTEQRPKINVVTVVWGEWHSSAFFRLNLPTLFAPGNLPALIAQYMISYEIYTRTSDIEKIAETQGYRWLRRLMPVRLNPIAEELIADPIRAHREIWFEAIEKAKRDGAIMLLMPPDVAWSDGSLRHVGKLLTQGRKVIFNFYLRVVSDTFAQDFIERYRAPNGVIAVPPREMVEFSMRHIHPLMAAYSRHSENFPHHAEMILWPVRGEGLLVRVLARECLLLDPNVYSLNNVALIGNEPRPGEIEFVADSDDFFAISLAPLGANMEWCLARQKVEFFWLARWWLHYDSPTNELTAATKVLIHFADLTESKWRQVEFGADLFVHRAAIYREALRSWRALHEMKCDRTAELLALAIHTGAIAHLTPAVGRLVILAPSDNGLDLIPEGQLAFILEKRDGAGINGLIRAHVAVLSEGEPDLETRLERERQVELTALDGSKIRLSAERCRNGCGGAIVNDIYKTSGRLHSGRNLILRLEGVLHSVIGPVPPLEHTSDESQAAEPGMSLEVERG